MVLYLLLDGSDVVCDVVWLSQFINLIKFGNLFSCNSHAYFIDDLYIQEKINK